jgi:catechol 2,3-dioxygenase-like lactoylglutathione lyase family enzyme
MARPQAPAHDAPGGLGRGVTENTMTNPRVSRLRGVALNAPNAPASAGFYTEAWGLTQVAASDGAVYLRGTGPEHHVLSLHDAPVRGIRHINFAVQDEAGLRALHAHAVAKGAAVLSAPAPLDQPGGGIGFDMVDPDHRRLRLSCGVEQHVDTADAPDRPRKITHLVLNTPQLEAALAFYQDVLGFRVSDWSEQQMVFIRCNSDHHSISFNRADHASLNHAAFEMPSVDAEMRGIGRLKAKNCPVRWGVGRHGPGNNVFAYFVEPNGFVIEYTTEVQQIDEHTHEPQVWKRVPHLMDRWGTAGPPSPEMRAAMAGTPDPGVEK